MNNVSSNIKSRTLHLITTILQASLNLAAIQVIISTCVAVEGVFSIGEGISIFAQVQIDCFSPGFFLFIHE